MPLYIIRKMIYIIRYRNIAPEMFLNKMQGKIESLLERIVFPQYYKGLAPRSNKDFLFNNIWSVTST